MKSLDEFAVLFANLFYHTDSATIKAETVFHELDEWSSLIALSVIAMVHEEFQVTLRGDDLQQVVTVEDLYHLVESRM